MFCYITLWHHQICHAINLITKPEPILQLYPWGIKASHGISHVTLCLLYHNLPTAHSFMIHQMCLFNTVTEAGPIAPWRHKTSYTGVLHFTCSTLFYCIYSRCLWGSKAVFSMDSLEYKLFYIYQNCSVLIIALENYMV